MTRGKTGIPIIAVVALAAVAPAAGQETADFFRQNCMSCHTIGGGRLTGPDLKGVTQRKDRQWLAQFIQAPQDMISRGDAYALKLQEEARGIVMPNISGLDKDRIEALLSLIDAESKLEKSQFAGVQISDRPFTWDDVVQGRLIFTGERPLKNGGPPCLSCHTLRAAGGLGGGHLGPDLTKVYERLEGRKNLAAWLTAPATPTMQPVFKKRAMRPEEILPLIALFEHTAKEGGPDDRVGALVFLLLGLGGTGVALVIFGSAWKWRFKTVRQSLVAAAMRGGRA